MAWRYRHRVTPGPWPSRPSPAVPWRRPSAASLPVRRSQHGTPTWRSEKLARVEAVLFLAREPLASGRIAQLANLPDGNRARKLVLQLASMYDQRGSAFQVAEVAGGFQLLTRGEFSRWLRRLAAAPLEVRLSAPAMETLAVVAYRQPVNRAEVEAIRGVQSGEILRQLIERELVRIAGRSQELGRPFLYGTTKQFLRLFGLRSLEELPRARSLRAASLGALANTPPEGNISSTSPAGVREEEEAAAVSNQMASDSPMAEEHPLDDQDPARVGGTSAALAERAEADEDWDEAYEDDEEYEDEYDEEYEDDDSGPEPESDDDDEYEDEEDEEEDDSYDDFDEEDPDEEYEDEDLEGEWEEVEDEDAEDDVYEDEDEDTWADDEWDYEDDEDDEGDEEED